MPGAPRVTVRRHAGTTPRCLRTIMWDGERRSSYRGCVYLYVEKAGCTGGCGGVFDPGVLDALHGLLGRSLRGGQLKP